MEEMLKKIENEVNAIKEEQKNLDTLTGDSEKARHELKEKEEERDSVSDRQSGFYKDLSQQVKEKNEIFINANNKRMAKDREINNLVSKKRESILKELEEKKQYIVENRNADLEGVNLEELKAEKAKIEKELKLSEIMGGTPEFEKLSDSEKQEVRIAHQNTLNNKKRLAEITPTIKLMATLDGKTPKDKFMEVENLTKLVKENFNRDNIDKVLNEVKKDKSTKQEPNEEKQEPKEEKKENSELEDEFEEFSRQLAEHEKREENVSEQNENTGNSKRKNKINTAQDYEKNDIILDVTNNKIKLNGKTNMLYRKETRNKKDKIEKYAINSIFYKNKNKKNIDFALISALEKIDDKNNSLVKAYLDVIRNGKSQSEDVKENIEKLNSVVDIEYKFSKDDNFFSNLKAKKLARNAFKLGISSLVGINEKSVFDVVKEKFSKIKNTKLLKGKEKLKALGDGKNSSIKENEPTDIIEGTEKNTKKSELRDSIKVDNKDNKIEKEAQKIEQETLEQMGKEVKNMGNDEQVK